MLVATKPLRYGGRHIPAGANFDASERDARTFIATGRAMLPLREQLERTSDRIVSARIVAKAIIDGRKEMSITGADRFAGMLRGQIAACKAGLDQARGEMQNVLKRGQEVKAMADQVVAQAQKEVAELEGELRQLSNFPPVGTENKG